MRISPTTFTVADLCNALKRKEVVINRDYQRQDRVWPSAARSFLIETILLGYPVPKLSFYQKTDLTTRKTIKEIVDGQQRSMTILKFFEDDYRLSRTFEIEEARGKSFSQLPEDLQTDFLDYALSVDLFKAASEDEIREAFRRINSYTVPLNNEEQRHAQYQGEFKWYAYELSKSLDKNLLAMGVFTERQLVRMQDTKLFCEITHAYFHGIKTTNTKMLDTLYKDHDKEDDFADRKFLENSISDAVNYFLALEEIHGTPLMKTHVFYSLILAYLHSNHDIESLRESVESQGMADREVVVSNLTLLSDELESSNDNGEFSEFYKAWRSQ